MYFSFHNQLKIKTKNKIFQFYNTILKSTIEQLSNFEKYNEYISIGNGNQDSNFQNDYHLTNPLITLNQSNISFQSDISKGSLFAKYEFVLSTNSIASNNITEAGLSTKESNPKIYNYFSLISEDTPQGININPNEEIVFEVTIYLTINENNDLILTSGNNPFIEFLLGNGFNTVYICRGSNYSENERINRQYYNNTEKFPCNIESSINNNELNINFQQNLNVGELDEILFVSNDKVFARKNLKEVNPTIIEEKNLSPKSNYIIKIADDIKSVNSIINNSTQTVESKYFVSKYANSFGEKINLPFNNLFNSTTSRFLSKDGKYIFFVLNDKLYGYINEDFSILQLNTSAAKDEYITKIISFDKYVFIFSQIEPYISTYLISDYSLTKIENNFNSTEIKETIKNNQQLDVVGCNNNKFIIGIIKTNKTALSIYFQLSNNRFEITSQITNTKEFNYLLAMHKNNFCDGQIIYLKEGNSSIECRIVTHLADETETDIYSSFAYHLTKDAINIYCKNRAIISEKNTEPSVVIYYYPQVYEYNLPIISNEIKDYISHDLNYIIQELQNNEFKIYNLVGYDTPEEFSDSISNITNTSTIVDFEFMKDTLLIFTNEENNSIIGVNLNLNKTQIENLSDKNSSYKVNMSKYDKIGKDNKPVSFTLSTRIKL